MTRTKLRKKLVEEERERCAAWVQWVIDIAKGTGLKEPLAPMTILEDIKLKIESGMEIPK